MATHLLYKKEVSTLRKTVGKIISTTLFCVVILLSAALLLLGAFGVRFFTVRTGSMHPAYPIGSVIVVCPAEFSELKKDDVITFYAGNSTAVTHRIYQIDKVNKTVSTKGDNNNIEDNNIVTEDKILGKVVFSVQYLGYVSIFADTVFGKTVIISTVVGVVLLCIINSFIRKKSEQKNI